MVVAGILIALGVQSWWQGRTDRAREHEYLRQLLADLRETERSLAAADSASLPSDRAGALLLRAFFTPARPPRDSVLGWYWRASYYQEARPVLGTAEALVSTGDLALLREPGLRTAITAYLEESRAGTETQALWLAKWLEGMRQVEARLDYTEIYTVLPPAAVDSLARANALFEIPPGARRRPFPVDTDVLLADRDVYVGVTQMNMAKQNMIWARSSMLRSARSLREQVEAASK